MKQTRRGFLGAVGGAVAATAGCVAPATDPGGTQRFERVYDQIAGAVTRVRTYSDGRGGQGSAFRYSDTHLVTNDHVVGDPNRIRVQYADGEWRGAEVVGRDPYSDLAVLRASQQPPGPDLDFVEEQPAIGAEVLAVGAPFGLDGSATAGIVSGHNRSIPAPNNFTIPAAIQTDAALNPGNSGGPIVDLDGGVVGVATAQVPGAENLGFGVSAELARLVVPNLVETGTHRHSFMGVGVAPVEPLIAAANDLPSVRGVFITSVLEGGPADGVLRGGTGETTVEGTPVPTGGDVVIGLNETDIRTQGELSRFLALQTSPGDTIDVRIWRDEAEETVELTLGERPDPN